MLCIRAPDMPSAPPASMPNTVLGILCNIIAVSRLSGSFPRRTSITLVNAILLAPSDIENIAIIESRAKHKMIENTNFFFPMFTLPFYLFNYCIYCFKIVHKLCLYRKH